MAVWWIFFPCSRGVRQGDPLSPLLLCLAEEVLSRGLSKLVNDKKILHMAGPQGFLTPSHVLYADDIFVFCRVDNKSLRNFCTFIKTYGDFSGQYVNNSKSSFFPMDNSARFVTKIQRILSCIHGCFPFNYLRVHIYIGAPKSHFLQTLADKVKLKHENNAYLLKLAWNFSYSNRSWSFLLKVRVLKSKYKFKMVYRSSSLWP